MLDEKLPTNMESSSHRERMHEDSFKLVLVEKKNDDLDLLPEGWVRVHHNSGMPVYLNKATRVCTLSRPYFLGPGSARV